MGETLHESGIEKEEGRILQQPKLSLHPTVINLYKGNLLGLKVPLHQNLLFVFDYYLIQYQPLSNPLGPSSSTHSLQIHCTQLIGPRSHTSWAWLPKSCPYNIYIYIYIYMCVCVCVCVCVCINKQQCKNYYTWVLS